jgi:tripartite-type tricarboxylate transporter receptor subunit TctC
MLRLTRRALLATGAAALLSPSAQAQSATFPDRPIRLIVPFPPGGVNDAVARPWAEAMKTRLGTVAVDNVGGGGSVIGTNTVARSRPDGYTLLLGGAAGLVVNPVANPNVTYHPVNDFEAVSLLAMAGLAIAVHPSIPANNLLELIAHIKANPGKLFYASSGVGTAVHLAGELFKQLIGAPELGHVPYRGAAQSTTDLLAGQVSMSFVNITGQLMEFHRTGKLKVLATTNPQRMASVPEIPTAVEAGLPGMVAQNFTGIFAPAGTPRDVINRIALATEQAVADPEYQRLVLAAGLEPVADARPEAAKRFLLDDIARWTPLIKAIGLQTG